jgi:ABC-type spermidine/putrescine transport system permease subunit II
MAGRSGAAPTVTSAIRVGVTVALETGVISIVIQAGPATIGFTWDEASGDLGAGRWRTFRRVTVPQLMPAVVVAFVLMLSWSLDGVVTSLSSAGRTRKRCPCCSWPWYGTR